MKPFKSILVSAGALTLIAAVATAALAGTNALTAGKIAENTEKAANEARLTVIEADRFRPETLTAEGKEITYYVADKGGEVVGYVFTVTTSGKSSGLSVMTGIGTDGKVTGVAVIEENETAGYVDKVTKGGLLSALVGKTSTEGVDTVSQATKTSKGVKKGVDAALAYYAGLNGEGDAE